MELRSYPKNGSVPFDTLITSVDDYAVCIECGYRLSDHRTIQALAFTCAVCRGPMHQDCDPFFEYGSANGYVDLCSSCRFGDD